MTPDVAKELHEKIEVFCIKVYLNSACIAQQFFLIINEDLGHDFCEELKPPLLSMEIVELVIAFIAHTVGGIINI